MTSAIGPGDVVEAAYTYHDKWGFRLEAGQLYTIRDLYQAAPGFTCTKCAKPVIVMVQFKGEQNYSREDGGWCTCAVKPIYRPKAKLIEDLLKVDELSPIEVLFEISVDWKMCI